MNITTHKPPGRTRLSFEGEMTIYHAAALKQALCEALAAGRPCTLELADVSALDTTGIQLLAMARRDAAAAGLPLTLRAASPAVLEALSVLRLESWCEAPTPADDTPAEPAPATRRRGRRNTR